MKNVRVGKEYKTKVYVGTEEIDIQLEMLAYKKTHKNVHIGWWDTMTDKETGNIVGVMLYR